MTYGGPEATEGSEQTIVKGQATMSRTTPTSADLMPEVLQLLKRQREPNKDAIAKHMRDWITEHRFDDRDRSTGWALNRLEKEGYLEHPEPASGGSQPRE